MRYTSAHWGVYQVETGKSGCLVTTPLPEDPNPSGIGFDLYEPQLDALRVRRPAVRQSWLEHGPGTFPERRGSDPMVEVSWDRALELAAAEIARVVEQHGNEAVFAGSYGWASAGRFHHGQSQVHRFMNCLGGYVRHVNTYSLGVAHALMPYLIAPMRDLMADHTSWDVVIANTRLFVTFGGIPRKNTQVSPGGVRRHFTAESVAGLRAAGVRIVNFSPVRDNVDDPNAEWVPIRPGTDTAVMLALAYVLLDDGLHDASFLARYCTGFDRVAEYLLGRADGPACTAEWAELISGVPADYIVSLARDMAGTRTMLNMAWSLQRASHGEQPCWMLLTLAAMLGQIGQPGGGFAFGYGTTNALGSPFPVLPGPTLSQGRNPVDAFIPVARISDMLLNPGRLFPYGGEVHRYPDVRLIYWVGGNPYHHHQDLNRLGRAWRKPETIIVHEQFWTATARRADIVFPASTVLERNDLGCATREGHLVAMRQARAPVGEARSDYDIFCGLSEKLGITDAFTEGRDELDWLRKLYEDNRKQLAGTPHALPPFDEFWEVGLLRMDADAGPNVMLQAFRADPVRNKLPTPSGLIELHSQTIAAFDLKDCKGHASWFEPSEWLGNAEPGDLHMLSDQPERRLHSQLDAGQFSQEGKIDGREPIMINDRDAAERGIAHGDVVLLSNKRGSAYAAAIVTPDIMRGVVKLSTGAWYDPDATGRDRHGNPNVLTLDVGTSSLTQGCSAQTCLVKVTGPVNEAPPVKAFELPRIVSASSVVPSAKAAKA